MLHCLVLWGRHLRACRAGEADGRSLCITMQEDRCLLVAVRTMTQDEISQHGPLPAAAARRRRGAVNPGSCFRCEALPPTAGAVRASCCTLLPVEPPCPQ